MVFLKETKTYVVVANQGFVWRESKLDGSEYVYDDDEAEEAWASYRKGQNARQQLSKRINCSTKRT